MIPLGAVCYQPATVGPSPVGSHLFWRVRTDRNSATSSGALAVTSVNEIEMRATPGGVDLCTGGTAIALNVNASTPASRAFDGSLDYINNATVSLNSGQPWWIGYQFASPVEVKEVAVWRQQYSDGYSRAPGTVYIDYSDDGTVWTNVAIYLAVNWAVSGPNLFAVPYQHTGDDPAFPWVSSYIRLNGADESTTIADAKGLTWTMFGGAKIDDAVKLDGENTALFNGGGAYAYCVGGDFNFGIYDVDVEGTVYLLTVSGNQTICDFRHGGANSFAIYAGTASGGAGKLSLASTSGIVLTHQTAMVANTWYRWKACRRGGYWKLYLSGVKSTGTYTAHLNVSYGTSAGRMYIGDNYLAPSQPLLGRLGPTRVTRYARQALDADFTPDALPWPNN